MAEGLMSVLRTFAVLFVIATVVGLVGFMLIARRLRRIQLIPNADFVQTLRAVPFGLVLALDLLDFGLNIFSAPITWILLSRYKLQGLRTFAVIKDLIPFDGPLPLMSLAWVGVRVLGLGPLPNSQAPVLEADEVEPGHYIPRTRR